MKNLIIGVLIILLGSSAVFAMTDAERAHAIKQLEERQADSAQQPVPDMDDLTDYQDFKNINAIQQYNSGGGNYYGYGGYPYPPDYSILPERRAVIIPGASAEPIDSVDDIEYNSYLYIQRPK